MHATRQAGVSGRAGCCGHSALRSHAPRLPLRSTQSSSSAVRQVQSAALPTAFVGQLVSTGIIAVGAYLLSKQETTAEQVGTAWCEQRLLEQRRRVSGWVPCCQCTASGWCRSLVWLHLLCVQLGAQHRDQPDRAGQRGVGSAYGLVTDHLTRKGASLAVSVSRIPSGWLDYVFSGWHECRWHMQQRSSPTAVEVPRSQYVR
jgi:hypothetical protein